MKHSKNSIALLAQHPTFRDWVLQNLTPRQIDEVCQSPRGSLSFSIGHPLNDEKLAAAVFRAYRQEVIGCIQYQFANLEDFGVMRGQGTTWNAFYHGSLINAIALMVEEYPEVLTQALAIAPARL